MGVVMIRMKSVWDAITLGSIFGFIISLQFGCCTSLKNKKVLNSHEKIYKIEQTEQLPDFLNNFVFLHKSIVGISEDEICYFDTHNWQDCQQEVRGLTSASGLIYKVDNQKLLALTAAHWCSPLFRGEIEMMTDQVFERQPIIVPYANFMGESYALDRMSVDLDNDICVVEFTSNYAHVAKNMEFAKEAPKIGEKIYSVGSPEWVYDPNIRNVFEGRFSGSDEYEFIFTIPATYGSSGSGVINENGEIISIITKASVDFKNITFGPTIDQLHHFLERLEE